MFNLMEQILNIKLCGWIS